MLRGVTIGYANLTFKGSSVEAGREKIKEDSVFLED